MRMRVVGLILACSLLVIPFATIDVFIRQSEAARREAHHNADQALSACEAARDDRATLLDLIDFATQPSDFEPDVIAQPELANAIAAENRRSEAFRAYAHDHLPPIICTPT